MSEEGSDRRRAEIEAAAFELLVEKGYRSTSMLQIAKRAKASNQTLYAWYGNKQTLFRNLIVENSKAVRDLLNSALERHDDPLETLEALGPLLLSFTTDDKAIIINRAAIIDATETGLLAEAIEETARDVIYPLICALMERLASAGRFVLDNGPADAADAYIELLFGEFRMRQMFGAVEALDDAQRTARAARAFALTCRLYRMEGRGDGAGD